MKPLVQVQNLTKRYGPTVALNDVSLEIESGEVFALLGPNGAGKTTLVHILCTIQAPNEGTARVSGMDVVRQPRKAREKIGVVFQEPSLDDRLTVYENLDFHGRIYGVPRGIRNERIEEMLHVVGLEETQDRLVRTLSTGMKRRLEIARALVHQPKLLFLDEPTVGLDTQTRHRIWDYIRELQRLHDLTVLVTTHYIEEVEHCHRVCIIDHGSVLAVGRPGELKSQYGQERLQVIFKAPEDVPQIVERYAGRVLRHAGAELELASDGEAFVESFLSAYGTRVRALSVVSVSLESVFLALTGREIRDEEAGPRERLYAFGRRGGEHTG